MCVFQHVCVFVRVQANLSMQTSSKACACHMTDDRAPAMYVMHTYCCRASILLETTASSRDVRTHTRHLQYPA